MTFRRSWAAIVTAVLVLAIPIASAVEPIRLPTAKDAQTILSTIEGFFGSKNVERVLPGPVEDREVVTVSSDLSGQPNAVVVRQRLILHGIGDYFFRVPGPALEVEPLPESQSDPGIRRGSILWQGFSSRRRLLGAKVTLDPAQELQRLPLKLFGDFVVDGQPLEFGDTATGELDARIVVENVAEFPINVAKASSDPEFLGQTLSKIHDALAGGGRPVPGQGGIPRNLPARSKVEFELQRLQPAMDVALSIPLAPQGLTVKGATRGEEGITLHKVIGGGAPTRAVVRISGPVQDFSIPSVRVLASGVPPPAFTAESPPHADPATTMDLVLTATWRTALLVIYDAYLGNPDATGSSVTSYRYVMAPKVVEVVTPPPPLPEADDALVLLSLVALLLLAVAATTAWSLA